MQISPSNLHILVKVLPYLQYINVEIWRGFLKDMTMFHHLTELRSLNISLNRFDRNHHVFHRQTHELTFKNPPFFPKLTQLKIMGPFNPNVHRVACIKCILYMAIIYPNITRLELSLNLHESINDHSLRLIFHHLTSLEILGVTSCKDITDDAFTGTFTKNEGHSTVKKRKESFAISNLKYLHTVLLYPLENITDVTFVEAIAKLPNLKRLAINGLNEVTSKAIEVFVEGCQKMEVVYFEDCAQFDENHVKFLLNRLIYLKYLRVGCCPNLPDELAKLPGLELIPIRGTENRNAVWKAHNAYKIATEQMPLNILDLE